MIDQTDNHISAFLSLSGQVGYVWDVEKDQYQWFGSPARILGLDAGAVPASNAVFNGLINPQDLPRRLNALHALTYPQGGMVIPESTVTYRLRSATGAQHEVREVISPASNLETGGIMIRGIISQIEAAQAVAIQPAQAKSSGSIIVPMDDLGHGGRARIKHAIQKWLEERKDVNHHGYLLAVGIDRLSFINEAYGAELADLVIDEVGRRLLAMLGDYAVISRISGDIFGVFLSEAPFGEMHAIAQHITNAFQEMPVKTMLGPVRVGVSVGGVVLDEQAIKPSSALTKAEHALREAKNLGRGCFVPYSDKTDNRDAYRLLLRAGEDFMSALQSDRVRLAYQPVMDSKSRSVSFNECLIRMIGEDGKMVSAAHFMKAIEDLGLSRVVDRYTMRLAIRELSMYPDLSLSVNVTNWTLTDPNWLRGVVSSLRDRPDVASRLIVEITENIIMQDVERTVKFVRTLQDLGCRVALDDFGVGQTAFTHLRQLNVDIVKIDKSFIRNIKDRKNHLFVQALQTLASGVNIQTVGEGAETLAEANMLADDGIDHIQGYYYGFPMTERIWLPKDHAQRKIASDETAREAQNAGFEDLRVSDIVA